MRREQLETRLAPPAAGCPAAPLTTLPVSTQGTTHTISNFADLKYYAAASRELDYEGITVQKKKDTTWVVSFLCFLSGNGSGCQRITTVIVPILVEFAVLLSSSPESVR